MDKQSIDFFCTSLRLLFVPCCASCEPEFSTYTHTSLHLTQIRPVRQQSMWPGTDASHWTEIYLPMSLQGIFKFFFPSLHKCVCARFFVVQSAVIGHILLHVFYFDRPCVDSAIVYFSFHCWPVQQSFISIICRVTNVWLYSTGHAPLPFFFVEIKIFR